MFYLYGFTVKVNFFSSVIALGNIEFYKIKQHKTHFVSEIFLYICQGEKCLQKGGALLQSFVSQ